MKPPKSATKLDRERFLKKQSGEDLEKITAMGQESEKKSVKWVQEVGKEMEQEEKRQQDNARDYLEGAKKKVFTYKDALLKEMRREMLNWEEELPKGFNWFPMYTSKGLVMWLKNNKGEWFAKGLKLSGEPKYDLNGVARLIVGAVEEASKQMEKSQQTDNGIILPYK